MIFSESKYQPEPTGAPEIELALFERLPRRVQAVGTAVGKRVLKPLLDTAAPFAEDLTASQKVQDDTLTQTESL